MALCIPTEGSCSREDPGKVQENLRTFCKNQDPIWEDGKAQGIAMKIDSTQGTKTITHYVPKAGQPQGSSKKQQAMNWVCNCPAKRGKLCRRYKVIPIMIPTSYMPKSGANKGKEKTQMGVSLQMGHGNQGMINANSSIPTATSST